MRPAPQASRHAEQRKLCPVLANRSPLREPVSCARRCGAKNGSSAERLLGPRRHPRLDVRPASVRLLDVEPEAAAAHATARPARARATRDRDGSAEIRGGATRPPRRPRRRSHPAPPSRRRAARSRRSRTEARSASHRGSRTRDDPPRDGRAPPLLRCRNPRERPSRPPAASESGSSANTVRSST